MKSICLLVTIALVTLAAASAQTIATEWHGAIEVENDAPLRLALHIAHSSDGKLTATIDSIDEGGMDLAIDSITVQASTMTFEMRSIRGVYEGKIAADGSRIVGSWSQDHAVWPLTWFKGEDSGNTWTIFDEQQAMENGRTYSQWFYQGKLADLWHRLSPVLQQELVSESKFHDFREQTLKRMGLESNVIEESARPDGALQVYRRLARFDRSGDVELTLAFDSRGAVARFNIRPLNLQ